MSLTTGCHLNCNHWTSLPMPQDVIDRVHTLTHRHRTVAGLIFADRHGVAPDPVDPNSDDDDDSSYAPSEQGSDDSSASNLNGADPNIPADPTDIAGVDDADIAGVDDDKDKEPNKEPNEDDDGYIEIPGVNNNNANNIKAAQLPDNNYYPPDFHAEMANEDMPKPEDDATPIDDPNDNNIPLVKTVEGDKDMHNPLERAMDE